MIVFAALFIVYRHHSVPYYLVFRIPLRLAQLLSRSALSCDRPCLEYGTHDDLREACRHCEAVCSRSVLWNHRSVTGSLSSSVSDHPARRLGILPPLLWVWASRTGCCGLLIVEDERSESLVTSERESCRLEGLGSGRKCRKTFCMTRMTRGRWRRAHVRPGRSGD